MIIIQYNFHNGRDDIYSFFSMSKKTFKMTIGNLYKQKKLSLEKTGIRLID